jgi:hypothetical protein
MSKTLKLYHYTRAENLLGISLRGLTPNVSPDEVGVMTMGQPVVWLTTQETLKPTQADLDHVAHRVGIEEAAAFGESMLIGRDTRLTVNLSTLSKKLIHYHSWLSTTDIVKADSRDPDDTSRYFTGLDVLKWLPPSAKEHWWVYFGTIKPARIDLQITAGLALPSAEKILASAMEKGDPVGIARATELREQIRAMPPDQPVRFGEVDEAAA